MVKRSKLLAILIAGVITTTAFVGCGSKGGDGNAASEEKKTLTVWSHFTTNEVQEFDKVAKAWGEENNVEVTVVEDQGEYQEMMQAAQSNNGPDIMLGVPHDNLGTFQKAGVAAEVPSGMVSADKYTSQAVVDAVTIGGKIYAVPFAQETTSMFYNKDLVKEVPKTMEELVEMAKEVGFVYNINDFYFSYAFLAANGGYVFKNNNGTLDPNDIGLGNEGAIKGLQFISDLVNKDKLMAADITGDIAKGEFTSGRAKEAGLNFGVMTMPTLGGKNPQTFLGVQTSIVNENSKNKDLAWELMKEFVDKGQDIVYKNGARIPVAKDYVVEDEYTKVFMEQAKVAYPMPNINEVQAIWTPAKNNLQLLTSGQIDAATAGKNMLEQTAEGIKQIK